MKRALRAASLATGLLIAVRASAVTTGTIVAGGQAMPEASVRADPLGFTPPPLSAAHDRTHDPDQRPGGWPLVAVTGPDGAFALPETPAGWGRVELRSGRTFHRSSGVAVAANAPVGTLALFALDDCLRLRIGSAWACERDLFRYAQPAILAQASTGSPPGPAAGNAEMEAQWALKAIGLPIAPPPEGLRPVVVALVDSGVDYAHPYLRPENIWRNPSPGADPSFPDDVLGWNFLAHDNQVWDDYGHGTFVAGLVVAVNPAARIMALKALDHFGGGPASAVSRAILYAVDHGARVVSLSLGSRGLTRGEQAAIDHARSRGAVVVAAAGNEGVDVKAFGPAGGRGLLGVASTGPDDRRAGFANWGQQVALSAPGVDLVSLRARWSDFLLVTSGGKGYRPGTNVVGRDGWFFRASGTSFSAALVAGAASLLLARDPGLTPAQVERMLAESADDVEVPGWDQFTGAGRLNVARALQADPDEYLTARVSRISPMREGRTIVVKVFGTAAGSRLQSYEIQIGRGTEPASWTTVASKVGRTVEDGVLAALPIHVFSQGTWVIRVLAHDDAQRSREARATLNVE